MTTKAPKRSPRAFSALHAWVYRMSGGRIGASIRDGDIVLLTTIGRKTGKPRIKPLIAINHRGGWVVAGSFGGDDLHPAWYLNLQAQPRARLRVANVDHAVTARDVPDAERAPLWARLDAAYAEYRVYRRATDRDIPLVHLTPV